MASTFTLGEKYEDLLDELVSSGDFGNKSEAVRAALRLLQRDRVQWSDIIEGHRAALADPRPAIARDEAFARLRSRYTTVVEGAENEETSPVAGGNRKHRDHSPANRARRSVAGR